MWMCYLLICLIAQNVELLLENIKGSVSTMSVYVLYVKQNQHASSTDLFKLSNIIVNHYQPEKNLYPCWFQDWETGHGTPHIDPVCKIQI